jgi:hypothetical protein
MLQFKDHFENIFKNTPPWGLYYKTFSTCNLQETDIFCSKLVSSGLNKHNSILLSLYITNL